MSIEYQLILVLAILVVLLFLLWRRAQRNASKVTFAKQSLSTKYGKMTEQFLPFLAEYPYDPQQFRFLGTPVDGVQFTDDKIVFIEFKTAGATLSPSQRKIKNLIERRDVDFKEIRLDG
jgi:predicted Holliday junction resolvase-like endonuclease